MATRWRNAPFGTGDLYHGFVARRGQKVAYVRWECGFETLTSRILHEYENWPICGPRVHAHSTLYGAKKSAERRLRK